MASIEVTFSKTVIHCTALIAYNLLYNFWTLGPALHICLTPELNNNLHTHANFHLKQAASIQQVPFCALFICKMRYRLLAEKLQTSALIQGLPVLQLTLQLGPCIQIYIHQVVECVESNHSAIGTLHTNIYTPSCGVHTKKNWALQVCSKVCRS